MTCTREQGHDWHDDRDHDPDKCPMHTVEIEAQRIANNLHQILNRQLGTSTHSELAHCQAPLYRAVEAATMAAFIVVTGSKADAERLRDFMLDDSGEGIWWWLDALARAKQDDAKEAAEYQADVAFDAATDAATETHS